MNGIIDNHRAQESEITIRVWFVDGDSLAHQMNSNDLDGVQSLMDWWRDHKRSQVWTWHIPSEAKIHMLSRSQITLITIEGYIEPQMNKVKWYQRLSDKWQTFLYLRWKQVGTRFKSKGGGTREGQKQAEQAC